MPVNPALVESMSGERRIGASHFENRVIPTIDPMNPSREELHSRAEPPSCDLHAILCHVPETDACDARRVDEQSASWARTGAAAPSPLEASVRGSMLGGSGLGSSCRQASTVSDAAARSK